MISEDGMTDTMVLDQENGEGWTLWNADCVDVTKTLPDNSVHFTIYSPPFESLYTFSDNPRDISNNNTSEVFWEHYGHLIKEMVRATMPGRLIATHCMQLPTSKTRDGFIGMRDFRGEIIRAFQKEGMIFHSEVMIRKDPVSAMQRSKSIGLLHKQLCKDSTMSRMAAADYMVLMRKPGDNPEPVAGPFDKYYGVHDITQENRITREKLIQDAIDHILEEVPELDENVAKEIASSRFADWNPDPDNSPIKSALCHEAVGFKSESDHVASGFSVQVWQRYAESVWTDINQSDVLSHRCARDEADERHISPLQLTPIRRCIDLWSNPGDIVFSPFAGIGSELYCAVEMGRKAIGAELKESYYKQAVANLKSINDRQDTLF